MPTFPDRDIAPRDSLKVSMSATSSLALAAAEQLAASINRYWAERGYDADAQVVARADVGVDSEEGEFLVISNLVNGISTRRLAGLVAPGHTA